jgi:hypothetical protein
MEEIFTKSCKISQKKKGKQKKKKEIKFSCGEKVSTTTE